MCGIIGMISDTPVHQDIINGLEKLEYRGYDSIGIGFIASKEYHVVKSLGASETLLKEHHDVITKNTSLCGMGHTRWATHGPATIENAHPHVYKKLMVVHNGTIENDDTIRKFLKEHGYDQKGDTDSECIVQLLDYYYNKTRSMLQAIAEMTSILQGSYALCIASCEYPTTLYAIRVDSPLVVGRSETITMCASDQIALHPAIRQFYVVPEHTLVQLDLQSIRQFDVETLQQKRIVYQNRTPQEALTNTEFETHMLREIYEQPKCLHDTLVYLKQSNDFHEVVGHIRKGINHLYIVGCGTAYHAGLLGAFWLKKAGCESASCHIASEFSIDPPKICERDVVIFISQSGETADTKKCLPLCTSAYCVGIVNQPFSSLAQNMDKIVVPQSGTERAVASTKGYMSQLLVLRALSFGVQGKSLCLLDNLSQHVAHQLSLERACASLVATYRDCKGIYMLGRGRDFSIAREASLKLKEISYIHGEALPAGELKHGYLAMIDETTLSILINTYDDLHSKVSVTEKEIRARKGNCVVLDLNRLNGVSKCICEEERVFLTMIPLQFIAYHFAVIRGTNIDRPRNLAKAVTVE